MNTVSSLECTTIKCLTFTQALHFIMLKFYSFKLLCRVASVVPVPVELARGSNFVDVDLGSMVEKASDSYGSACDELQQDAISASATADSFNRESSTNPFDGETSVNSSGTNTGPVSPTKMPGDRNSETQDDCKPVSCRPKYDTDDKKPDAGQIATVETCSDRTAEDASNHNDACSSLDQSSATEDASLCEDSEPVDPCKLRSALWPKSTLVTGDDTNCNFLALAADHQSYCQGKVENSTGRNASLSSCAGTGCVQDNHQALWPSVSRWMKESNQQFSRRFPECSRLIHGLSVPSDKHHATSSASSQKLSTSVDSKQTLDSAPFSSATCAQPVSSSSSPNSRDPKDSNDNSLGAEHLPSPALLSREKILSLQFSGIPLSSEVASRVKELKVKRPDGALRALNYKQVARNPPSSARPESNSSSIAVLRSSAALTEASPHSANREDAHCGQKMNQSVVENDAVSRIGNDMAFGSSTLPDLYEATAQHNMLKSADFKLENSTGVVNGKTGAFLPGCGSLQTTTSQSDKPFVVSHSFPPSDPSTNRSVADITVKSLRKSDLTLEATHKDAGKICTTGSTPLTSSSALQSISDNISAANMVTATYPEYTHPVKPTQRKSLATSERPCTKKYDKKATDTSQTLEDHGFHKHVASSVVQHRNYRSKHNIVDKDTYPETDKRHVSERRHKSRHDVSHNEPSTNSSVAGQDGAQSRSTSRRANCLRYRNVKGNADYDRLANHRRNPRSSSARHQNPYDRYDVYNPYCMNPSVLASISYSSYWLGAYNAHVHSMHYYNMLSHQDTAALWQRQAEYIRRWAKYCSF